MGSLYLVVCVILLSFSSLSMIPENVLIINDVSNFKSFQLERENLWSVVIFYSVKEKLILVENIKNKNFKSQIAKLNNPPEGLLLIGYSEDEKEEDLTQFLSDNKGLFKICNVTLYNQRSYSHKDLINKKQILNKLLSLHAKEEYSISLLYFNHPKELKLALFEQVEKRDNLKQSKKHSEYKNLFWFAIEHHPKMLPFLKENNARCINEIVNNNTPIIYCIKKRLFDNISILVHHQAINYTYLDENHNNILHHAIKYGCNRIINIVVEKPEHKGLIDQEDHDLNAPLLLAGLKGSETQNRNEKTACQQICTILLQKGSNPTLWSPLPVEILNHHLVPNCDGENKLHPKVRMYDWAINLYNNNFAPKPKLKLEFSSLFRIIIIKNPNDKLFTDWLLSNDGRDVEEFENFNVNMDENAIMLSNKGGKLYIETNELCMWANSTISPHEFVSFLLNIKNDKSLKNILNKINKTKFILFKKGK